MAEYYYSEQFGLRTFTEGPCSPETGPQYEGSIASFVFLLSRRDSRAFMDTWRYAMFTMTGENFDHANTVAAFWALWRDRDPDPGWIIVHHPGTWNVDAIYAAMIFGSATAVPEAAGAPLPTGIAEVRPNPGSGTFALRAAIPRGRNWSLVLFDASGRLVRSVPMRASMSREMWVDVSLGDIPAGIYFARIRVDGESSHGRARKVVVLR